MGTGFDFIMESAAPDETVDVAGAIAICTYWLAAVAGDQLLRVETEAVIGIPPLTAAAAVVFCD